MRSVWAADIHSDLRQDGATRAMSGDHDKLVGTWKLVSASSADSSGHPLDPPYGTDPVGFLTYTENGRVTALISYSGRKPLSVGAKPPALLEEQAEAFKTFFAYSGRYRLTNDKVVHSIEISSIQNYVNKELVRSVKFQGDNIVLVAPPSMVNGRMQTIELVWRRLETGS
jgi:Lipocalin-like domain